MRSINRSSRRGTLLLLTAAVAACGDLPAGVEAVDQDSHTDAIAALGFRTDMVEDRGDYYLVEGDIQLDKRFLRTLAGPGGPSGIPGPVFQYHSTALVSNPAAIQTIKVDLSHLASHPGWYNAAVEALTHWNAIPNTYIRMVQGTPANITVRRVSEGANLAGRAKFPRNGAPGDTVYLNGSFNPAGGPTHAIYLRNAVHELGHAIGFRHTNWNQVDCPNNYGQPGPCGGNTGVYGAVHVPGTPTSGGDGASVMNGLTAGQSWNGFSLYDRVAAARMYPIPAPGGAAISFPGGTPTMTWQPVVGATHYRVRLLNQYQWTAPEYGYMTYEGNEDVGTTTGTSFTDPSRWYTGVAECYFYYPAADENEHRTYSYSIEAVLSTGYSVRAVLPAPVATC